MIKIFKDYWVLILLTILTILLCVGQIYCIRVLKDNADSYKEKYEVAISERDYYKKLSE